MAELKRIRTAQELEELRKVYTAALSRAKVRILVCAGTGCVANGSLSVYEKLVEAATKNGLRSSIEVLFQQEQQPLVISKSGCHGFCQKGPLVRVEESFAGGAGDTLYVHVKPEDAEEIIDAAVAGKVVERLLYRDSVTGELFRSEDEIPFYRRQKRVTLEHCGKIDPEDIRDYIAHGGYCALSKALFQLKPEEVVSIIDESGLRGRGGGGFPTGKKWAMARAAKDWPKYVICNGDEGDPGAFMDRSVMEGDPHRVVEGMIVAGYAIGASFGYVYVRAEYPLAVRRMRKAVEEARTCGLLGQDIFGSGFGFDIEIREGAGAFVCGEETALIASIEGKRGMPRPRPPYPVENGVWGKPTVINNVETLANVPSILIRGPRWFRSLGTSSSAGCKTFALAGQVANTGLVEVPMGVTLREVIFDCGGGIRTGKKFKAAQIGGPSGGCLPESLLDLHLDYDSLVRVGAMVGSGGLVVMDESTCMVEVARFFVNFIQNESCGKCVPCREGTKQMLAILDKIIAGKATMEDLKLLEDVAQVVKDASLCGLGKTAPNPVLSTLKYFRDEYLAHVLNKRCPAGVCAALKEYYIDSTLCKGCTLCARVCPVSAIRGEKGKSHEIDPAKCTKCGTCMQKCRFGAVSLRS